MDGDDAVSLTLSEAAVHVDVFVRIIRAVDVRNHTAAEATTIHDELRARFHEEIGAHMVDLRISPIRLSGASARSDVGAGADVELSAVPGLDPVVGCIHCPGNINKVSTIPGPDPASPNDAACLDGQTAAGVENVEAAVLPMIVIPVVADFQRTAAANGDL